ncbi:unnamed protein product [Orchesella dallaii]|uniref:F-box domain-containing protein n=1 Tax=Orchesella dallaii TaxID=48710 RepID=A0ABP1R236_9HEXA
MAKLGAEYSGDITPTSEDSSEYSVSDVDLDSSSSDSDQNDRFPVMLLPVEIRAKILNMISQRQVPSLRLVSKQWRDEVDQFYEFAFNIYDTTSNLSLIRNLRCRECVIWKLTKDLKSESLFNHPSYLKVIKVFGPTSAANLKNLISCSTNLEHLTMTRRANYPWILNLQDTPALSNLTELRYLRLNSEEHLQIHRPSENQRLNLKVPPMMDCYFPKLKIFEILKRFPVWHYSHYVTSVLKFVSRHSATLTHIELDFIPLSCIAAWLGDRDMPEDLSSSEDDEYNYGSSMEGQLNRRRNRSDRCVSPQGINLHELCKIRLQKLCITTMGYAKDIHIWKSLLESQSHPPEENNQNRQTHFGLRELRFDWLCRDPMTETRARVSGFPWIHFQIPIEASSTTLVHVELANLSMVTKAFPSSPVNNRVVMHKVVPFDLSIFRHCTRLKSLILRCRENHARIHPVDLGAFGPRASVANGAVAVGGAVVGVVGAGNENKDDAVNGNGNNNGQQNHPHNAGVGGVGAAPAEQQGVVATVGEILLMINAMDLPESLEQLEIFRFPMLTSDIESCVRKLTNLRKLFFHECGKTNSFGVSADIIRHMAKLRQLKFLEIVGFNDSTEERRSALELVFQEIGRPFEGQDTWLELCDGSTTAFETLQAVNES